MYFDLHPKQGAVSHMIGFSGHMTSDPANTPAYLDLYFMHLFLVKRVAFWATLTATCRSFMYLRTTKRLRSLEGARC